MNVDLTLADRRNQAIRERALRALWEWRLDRDSSEKADEVLRALTALRDSLPEA